MGTSKAQQAVTARRRAQAIQLRLAGADYESIATQLEYASRGAAYTDISRALDQALVEQRREADVLRQEELLRLDRLQRAVWSEAVKGDVPSVLAALRIVDRRCKLLGLDAPTRHEVITVGAVEEEIRRLSELLGETAATG